MDESAQYQVKYKKKDASLRVTTSRIYCTFNASTKPAVTIMATDIKTQHVTAEGAAEPKLKIDTHDNQSYTFSFADKGDRDAVKERVAVWSIDAKRGATPAAGASSSKALSVPPLTSAGKLSFSALGRAGSLGALKRKRAAAGLDALVTAAELEARRALLSKNKELGKLFKDLVVTGTVDEEEFWEMRKSELETATFQATQKSGNLYYSLADIRPVEEDNTTTIKMTSEKIHSIFMQNPALHQAYNENVPEKISEKDFWTRYFESKYFYRSRRVVGSVAELGKADPLFDTLKDVLDIDANPDPRKLNYDAVNKLVDLSTTAEDHQETGNTPDVTMVAGKKKEYLPIIRKFNRISEEVLQQTLKDSDPRKKIDRSARGLNSIYFKETELEELEMQKIEPVQLLAIQEDLYFDTQTALSHTAPSGLSVSQKGPTDFNNLIQAWVPKFSSEISAMKTDSVLRSATESAKKRKLGYSVDQKLSISIYPQLVERQNSALELLRHFWGALNRPNKAAKTEKLAGALRALPKVLGDYLKEHPEASMVSKLMEPTLHAVEKALQAYDNRDNSAFS